VPLKTIYADFIKSVAFTSADPCRSST